MPLRSKGWAYSACPVCLYATLILDLNFESLKTDLTFGMHVSLV